MHGGGLGVREIHGGGGSEGERGGKDRGCLQCLSLLFLSEDQLPILLAGCVPSFLLSLAVEDGLNYWVFCSSKHQLKKKQIPLNSTFSFSMLPRCPQSIFRVFRQLQFLPLEKWEEEIPPIFNFSVKC